MITRAISAIKTTGDNIVEIRSNWLKVMKKTFYWQIKQRIRFHSWDQPFSVFFNPNIIKTETTENLFHAAITEVLHPNSLTLIPGNHVSLQVLQKGIWTYPDSRSDPNTSEASKSKDNLFDPSNHQFQFHNSVTLPILQFKRTQKHQNQIEAANQLLREQELERNPLLQNMNQPDSIAEDDFFTLDKTQRNHSTSRRYHDSKFLYLTFQYPFHSPFLLLQKDKNGSLCGFYQLYWESCKTIKTLLAFCKTPWWIIFNSSDYRTSGFLTLLGSFQNLRIKVCWCILDCIFSFQPS